MKPGDSKKICLISLGCPKNLVDAEMMLGFLKKDGFEFTTEPEKGDVIVVNTCGFVEDSKKESIDQILEMSRYKKEGNCEVLVATGCLTQRYSEQLSKDMPEVDLFVGLGEFDRVGQLLKDRFSVGATGRPPPHTVVSHKPHTPFQTARQILPDPDLPRIQATPKHFTYVKISEGCSHRCSFCIIPHIRGDLKSRSISSIVREVRQFVEQGVKEFNLIAQDLNEYGKDLRDGTHLKLLMSELDRIEGDFWIRPLYMYPLEFTDGLIEVMKNSEHIVKYVDMPLQHINDRIMRSMKRGSPARYVRQVLSKLKEAMPKIAVRTTFIVGYPGETEEEFQELYDFVKDYEFDRVGVFQYSVEEGTPAATLADPIASPIKQDRYHRLMSLQQKISLKKNQALVGETLRVLCEGPSAEMGGFYQARLESQAPEIDGLTYLSAKPSHVGKFVRAKIIEGKEYDLMAEVEEL
jgi:ribosomal protein S12 methylthiotransferase